MLTLPVPSQHRLLVFSALGEPPFPLPVCISYLVPLSSSLSLTHPQGHGGCYWWQRSACAHRNLPVWTCFVSQLSCIPAHSRSSSSPLAAAGNSFPAFSLVVHHWPADGRPRRELSVWQVSSHCSVIAVGPTAAQVDDGPNPSGHSSLSGSAVLCL